jgi:hypothetical protein
MNGRRRRTQLTCDHPLVKPKCHPPSISKYCKWSWSPRLWSPVVAVPADRRRGPQQSIAGFANVCANLSQAYIRFAYALGGNNDRCNLYMEKKKHFLSAVSICLLGNSVSCLRSVTHGNSMGFRFGKLCHSCRWDHGCPWLTRCSE